MKNARMDDYRQSDYSATAYGGQLWVLEDDKDLELGYRELKGVVQHDLGIVVFQQYIQWPTSSRDSAKVQMKYFTLQVNHNGREITRSWNAYYGKRTITRLANEFIEEIKGGNYE